MYADGRYGHRLTGPRTIDLDKSAHLDERSDHCRGVRPLSKAPAPLTNMARGTGWKPGAPRREHETQEMALHLS